MDILTEKGRETREQEAEAAMIFISHYPRYRYVETPKDLPAVIDALFVEGDLLARIAEMKCRVTFGKGRAATYTNFTNWCDWHWLVTKEKLKLAAIVADHLQVPLVGMLYLVPDKLLMMKRLYVPPIKNRPGRWLVKLNERVSETQANVNGGTAWRENAYIDMRGAAELEKIMPDETVVI